MDEDFEIVQLPRSFTIRCPACGKMLGIPYKLFNKEGRCKGCNEKFLVTEDVLVIDIPTPPPATAPVLIASARTGRFRSVIFFALFLPPIALISAMAIERYQVFSQNASLERGAYERLPGGVQRTPVGGAVYVPPPPPALDKSFVCDVFDVHAKITRGRLKVTLDTDLPEDTQVIVEVSRDYWSKSFPNGDLGKKYSLSSSKGVDTVAVWSKGKTIETDDDAWFERLENVKIKTRDNLYQGNFYSIEKISDSLSISAVLLAKQADPRFGRSNTKLYGKAVNTEPIYGEYNMNLAGGRHYTRSPAEFGVVDDIHTAESNTEVFFPLTDEMLSESIFYNLKVEDLKIGGIYILSRGVSLGSGLELKMLGGTFEERLKHSKEYFKTIRVPRGGYVKILDFYTAHHNTILQVEGYTADGQSIGSGQIGNAAYFAEQRLGIRN